MNIIPQPEKKYQVKKKLANYISLLFNETHQQRKLLFECAKQYAISLYLHKINKNDTKEKTKVYTCKSKFCPVCQMNKQNKWSAGIFKRATYLQKKENQRFITIVLTIKNCELSDLKKTIVKMNKEFNHLWKHHLSKDGRFNGFVRSLEITFNERKDNCHPHFHILLSCNESYFKRNNKKYLKTMLLKKIWAKRLKQKTTSVYMKIIQPGTYGKKNNKKTIIKEAIPAAISEMIKYPMKDVDYRYLNKNQMDFLAEQLHRVRMINTGGNLKIQKEDLKELLTEINTEEYEHIADYVYRFKNSSYELHKIVKAL